ncbi:MAG: metal ABC transporter solute-binding protein, Zn/Mn family [Hydrogeniiclostridium mannosilyticum]
MKKICSVILCLLMTAGILSGCGNNNTANHDIAATNEKLSIVTTIFPEYDWVWEIMGDQADNAEITMLLDNGVDLHSYQPTADDIIKISTCDMFIYVGGESDEWVEDALKEDTNKNMVVINLLDVLGDSVKTEELVEGMQESEHEHDHGGEIDTADIQDRTLSEFAGDWQSIHPLLVNGDLDEYLEHLAEEDGDDTTTADTYRERYTGSWECDATSIAINGSTITFTFADGSTQSADYTYAGYSPVLSEDGDISSVRYQFETDSTDAPRYVQFNDHGHEPGEAEHFHVYFGNESFEALMDGATNPFFAPGELDAEGVLEMLMGHDHEHEEEADEHVWLSLKNAEILCREIADQIAAIDPDNTESYSANAAAYIEKLSALDAQYQAAVDSAANKTVLFGDRFPFRYLVDDYGLDYYAAFVGCSAETEASFETITFLANKVDELGLSSVLTIEGAQHKIAETIVNNTAIKNQQVLTMDSMQATTSTDVENGANLLSVMESNLEVLKTALN